MQRNRTQTSTCAKPVSSLSVAFTATWSDRKHVRRGQSIVGFTGHRGLLFMGIHRGSLRSPCTCSWARGHGCRDNMDISWYNTRMLHQRGLTFPGDHDRRMVMTIKERAYGESLRLCFCIINRYQNRSSHSKVLAAAAACYKSSTAQVPIECSISWQHHS